MAGKVFGLRIYGFAEPFFDFGAIDIVVVDPVFVAGVIGRFDINAFDFSSVVGQEGFEVRGGCRLRRGGFGSRAGRRRGRCRSGAGGMGPGGGG
jgi:hypothetical protein